MPDQDLLTAAVDPSLVETYFGAVAGAPLPVLASAERVAIVHDHQAFAALRRSDGADVAVRVDAHPGSAVATSVTVVSLDVPYLVEAVLAVLARYRLPARCVLHPVVEVEDGAGSVAHESWIRVELERTVPESLRHQLAVDVRAALRDVQAVARDTSAMRAALVEVADRLAATGRPGSADLDAAETVRWLAADRFQLLGHRRRSADSGGGAAVTTAGLGSTGAWSNGPARPPLLVTTAPRHAVERHDTRPDLLVTTVLDGDGGVVQEDEFLGTLTPEAHPVPVSSLPLVRQKAQALAARAGHAADGFSHRVLDRVLRGLPLHEALQADVEHLERVVGAFTRAWLGHVVEAAVRVHEAQGAVSCLVYVPQDWYAVSVLPTLENVLSTACGAGSVTSSVDLEDDLLARVHLGAHPATTATTPALAVHELEQRLRDAALPGPVRLARAVEGAVPAEAGRELAARWSGAVSAAHLARSDLDDVVDDVLDMDRLDGEDTPGVTVRVRAPRPDAGRADLRRCTIISTTQLTLTTLLPVLDGLGVHVHDEDAYTAVSTAGTRLHVSELRLTHSAWESSPDAAARFAATVAAAVRGQIAADGLNGLVMAAPLDHRQVVLLRAVLRYLQQIRIAYTPEYLERIVLAHADACRHLVELFAARFDPDVEPQDRAALVAERLARVDEVLAAVEGVDADRVLQGVRAVFLAVVRTNAYQQEGREDVLALKIDTRLLPQAPPPRPHAEVWVYAPDMEGVHLRFGAISRGGVRWSDRPDDLRAEVLGLAKAQIVKNSLIVPTGSKGGFVVKGEHADRAAAVHAYRRLVHALIDVTDDLDLGSSPGGTPVQRARTVRYDGEDTYLVVAADKGTATFSDIANEVATARGYWLGDAFASGGRTGYDHKALGITARGAWESARSHFRRAGTDPDRDALTVVGIGDMSGDVFGNGMLLSRSIRLVGAFDHRHVFLDPDPDPEVSYAERQRLFALPRSSWADYDRSLLSEGGTVVARSAKSIELSAAAAERLGLSREALRTTPTEVIRALLEAPVDLLWNGGVGTYVKASTETHAEVVDKANDGVRVNADRLRARVVVEGGNLGVTQAGRIEAALNGVLVNTDAVDNSAGVDCSDHEVNIKIAVDLARRAGELRPHERDTLLSALADEVTALVLADNTAQNALLARSVAAEPLLPLQSRLLGWLEQAACLDRALEHLPSDAELACRAQVGRTLTAPELAVVAAHVKLKARDDLLAAQLVEDGLGTAAFVSYFPAELRRHVGARLFGHPLRTHIAATCLANDLVNTAGVTFAFRVHEETGAGVPEVVAALAVARRVFRIDGLLDGLAASPLPATTHDHLRSEIRRLLDRVVRWLLRRHPTGFDVDEQVAFHGPLLEPFLGRVHEFVVGGERTDVAQAMAALQADGCPQEFVARGAAVLYELRLLDVAVLADRFGCALDDVLRLYMAVCDRFGIALLLQRITGLPRDDKWRARGRSGLRTQLEKVVAEVVGEILGRHPTGAPAETAIDAWEAGIRGRSDRAREALGEVRRSDQSDFEAVSVAIQLFDEAVSPPF